MSYLSHWFTIWISVRFVRNVLWIVGVSALAPAILGGIARLFYRHDADDVRMHPGEDIPALRARESGPKTPEPIESAIQPWPDFPPSIAP